MRIYANPQPFLPPLVFAFDTYDYKWPITRQKVHRVYSSAAVGRLITISTSSQVNFRIGNSLKWTVNREQKSGHRTVVKKKQKITQDSQFFSSLVENYTISGMNIFHNQKQCRILRNWCVPGLHQVASPVWPQFCLLLLSPVFSEWIKAEWPMWVTLPSLLSVPWSRMFPLHTHTPHKHGWSRARLWNEPLFASQST